jgi:hypothetical protein
MMFKEFKGKSSSAPSECFYEENKTVKRGNLVFWGV